MAPPDPSARRLARMSHAMSQNNADDVVVVELGAISR
jgi:hypothetical protein